MRPEIRLARLRSDLEAVRRLEGKMISVRAAGDAPTRYELEMRVRSIIGPQPTYRDVHQLEITLRPGYPESPPVALMVSRPQPYHPNWFGDGRWCSGRRWSIYQGLADFILRVVKTLQFAPELIDPDDPANARARDWYLENLSRGLFPCDRQVLPDHTISLALPASKRLVIRQPGAAKKHFHLK